MIATQFNPALDQIQTNNYLDNKPNSITIGCNNESLASPDKILSTTYSGKIKNHDTKFNLSISAFNLCGRVFKETFMLEIEARESEEKHKSSLPLGGFGQHLHEDYAIAFDHIAKQFCDINGLIVNKEMSHWPILQYVVSKPA